MNICPSFKNIVSTKIIKTSKIYKDNFFSNKVELIDDEKIAHIREIYANTPFPFSILLLICQNWKNQPKYYCNKLFNPKAEIKVCELKKTDYISFYIKRWFEEKSENKPNDTPFYILAFSRYSKNDDEIPKKIAEEVKRTAEWLCISGSTIQCYIFYYTNNNLCITFDRGTLKKKYDDLCMDSNYIFQFKFVPQNRKIQYLSINGGSPRFTIEVKEIGK